ncbi:MAG TPA: DUF167 domain-containing protein [Chloroflexota bacterium]|nr:DUF167 domain-containing protein [Chloroflexota bacterium]
MTARLRVLASPGAGRDEISWAENGELRVRIMARAVDGKANQALLKFIADALDIPPSSVELTRGATSRHKLLVVHGLDEPEIRRRLAGTGSVRHE